MVMGGIVECDGPVRSRQVIRERNVHSRRPTNVSDVASDLMAEDVLDLEGDGASGASTARSAAPLDVDDDISAHEGQASDLAARPGALLLDYLRVRVTDDEDTWREVCEWMGSVVERSCGWRGFYDRSYMVLDGGILARCSEPARAEVEGILVDLPGRACGSMGERLVPFLEWALEHGRATRCDFAADDRSGRLTGERVGGAVRSGAVVTRWQSWQFIEGGSMATGEASGWTYYLGSRSSECLARVYDKAAERQVPGTWVRFELECKGELADALARAYFQAGSAAVVGQINRRLRFAVPVEGDTNKRRWPTASWWAEFIGSVEPGASLLCGERQEATISALSRFVERNAGPAMAAVTEACGGDTGWWYAMLERSRRRMKPKHRAAVNLFRREAAAVGVVAE